MDLPLEYADVLVPQVAKDSFYSLPGNYLQKSHMASRCPSQMIRGSGGQTSTCPAGSPNSSMSQQSKPPWLGLGDFPWVTEGYWLNNGPLRYSLRWRPVATLATCITAGRSRPDFAAPQIFTEIRDHTAPNPRSQHVWAELLQPGDNELDQALVVIVS